MVWILLASFFQTLLGKDFPILTNWNLEALFSFHFWDEIRFRPIFGFIVPSLVITNMAFPKKAACFCFSPPCAVRSSYPTDPTTLMVMVWYSKNPTEGPNFCFILGEVLWAEEPRRFCESRKFAKNWFFFRNSGWRVTFLEHLELLSLLFLLISTMGRDFDHFGCVRTSNLLKRPNSHREINVRPTPQTWPYLQMTHICHRSANNITPDMLDKWWRDWSHGMLSCC